MTAGALAAALAGEHATVWAYGLAGARLPRAQRARAVSWLDDHRGARDVLVGRLRGAGEPAPGPLPGYATPFPVTDRGERAGC